MLSTSQSWNYFGMGLGVPGLIFDGFRPPKDKLSSIFVLYVPIKLLFCRNSFLWRTACETVQNHDGCGEGGIHESGSRIRRY